MMVRPDKVLRSALGVATGLLRLRQPPPGSSPGTLALAEDAARPNITIIRFGATTLDEVSNATLADVEAQLALGEKLWVDVQGLGDELTMRRLATIFSIEPLALEDLVNAPQRPKIEEYEKNLLLITRMFRCIEGVVIAEQVGIVVGESYVVTFQERPGDVLNPVRARVRSGKGPMRISGPDYLAYALLDAVVDAYYPLVGNVSEELLRLETELLSRQGEETLYQLNELRKDLVALRRALAPQREALQSARRARPTFLSDDVLEFLRDPLDHCAQLLEAVDAEREAAANLQNMYLSLVGSRTNEVMQVLTILASIFIPLTFFAGLYGMNFDYMPELHVRWAYPALLGMMVLTASAMLAIFTRKGWVRWGRQKPIQRSAYRQMKSAASQRIVSPTAGSGA